MYYKIPFIKLLREVNIDIARDIYTGKCEACQREHEPRLSLIGAKKLADYIKSKHNNFFKGKDDIALGSVIVIKDNVIEENIPFYSNEEAEKIFLDKCRTCLSNYDSYTKMDTKVILDDGRVDFINGFISLYHF